MIFINASINISQHSPSRQLTSGNQQAYPTCILPPFECRCYIAPQSTPSRSPWAFLRFSGCKWQGCILLDIPQLGLAQLPHSFLNLGSRPFASPVARPWVVIHIFRDRQRVNCQREGRMGSLQWSVAPQSHQGSLSEMDRDSSEVAIRQPPSS